MTNAAQAEATQATSFLIHHNGGRPWQVTIDGDTVHVAETVFKKGTGYETGGPTVLSLAFTKLWIPKGESARFPSPNANEYPEHVEWIPWHDNQGDGNTILLQEPDGSYVHIGVEIQRFKTHEPVTEFRSPIGNSNVPYSRIYTENYIYIPNACRVAHRPTTRIADRWSTDGVGDPWQYAHDNGTPFVTTTLLRRW
jgi:hypothetical protein